MTRNPEESPTPGEVTHLNPETLHTNPAFTQVVTVTGPARTIYIGGQDALDVDGNIVGKGDLAAQTQQVLRNLRQAGAYHQMERLPAPGTILADRVYGLPAVLGKSAKPTRYHWHLRLRAGTPGFSRRDGCHCRCPALAPDNDDWEDEEMALFYTNVASIYKMGMNASR